MNVEEPIPDDHRITEVETGHKDLLGNQLKKIYVKRSSDVRELREKFTTHYEADILFTQRYIIDVVGEADIYKLHILALDIETNSRDSFPNMDDPDQEIISCSFVDNRGKKRKYLYKNPLSDVEIDMDKDTRVFKTEEQLLESIVGFIKLNDPDVITGWNVINFDLAYLLNRMKKLKVDYTNMSPLESVFCNKEERDGYGWDVKIQGRIIIDGMQAYKHFRRLSNQGRAESYSLEFTAQEVLNMGKIQHEESFSDMWKENPNELLKYNLRDSELVISILEKLEIIDFFNFIRAKSMSQLSQIYHTTSLIDGFLLREVHNKFVLPSKNKQDSEKYSGAFVFPPAPGLYERILALDLKSLYPNIIKTFNVGYETFNLNGEIKLDDKIGFDRGIGIISKMMRNLEKERKIYKKLMWQADKDNDTDKYKLNYYKQYSVKVIMNCFSSDTQLLTPNGEINIKDLKVGDVVYSIHPEKHILEEKKVTKTYEYDYNGEMINFNTQSVDLMVTPNHNMLVEDTHLTSYMVRAEDYKTNYRIPIHKELKRNIPDFVNLLENVDYQDYNKFLFKNKDLRTLKKELKNYNITYRKITREKCEIFCDIHTLVELWANGYDVRVKHSRNKNCSYNTPFIKMDDFSSFLGWFISEGFLYKSSKKGRRGITKSITICQHKSVNKNNYDEIKELLKRMFIRVRESNTTLSFSSDLWFDNLKHCGHTSKNKHLPEEWFNIINKKVFFNSLYKGDGHKNKNIYTTNSPRLKDQVLRTLTELGYKTWYNKDDGDCYRIKFNQTNSKPHIENISIVKNNSNKVYCVEVEDNHTVLAGRNGKFTWTGQSFYGFLGYPGSRLYRREVAEAITRWGVNIIQWSKKVLNNMGYDVVYGDTDSVYVQAKENTIFALLKEGKELIDKINKSYKTFSKNYGSDDCTLEMEFEKIFKKILFVGKKGSSDEGAKKKYAYILMWEENKKVTNGVKFTGFESVRSDTPRISRKLQTDIVKMLLNDVDRDEILDYLKKVNSDVRSDKIPLEDIAFPKGISKSIKKYGTIKMDESSNHNKTIGVPPVIRGAIYANRYLGKRYGEGSKPKWIYIKKTPFGYPHTDVLAFDDTIPNGFIIDYDKMIDKIIRQKTEEILLAGGFGKFPEIDDRQQKL